MIGMFSYFAIPAITLAVAATGGMITGRGMEWYRSVSLPEWTPDGSVIGTVWTVIFILATISALIVWKTFPRDKRFNLIIGLFITNAFLNVLWSALFFGLHLIGAAVIEAALLGASVLALMVLIWPRSKTASLLLLPYLLWVSFATYLNYVIWTLNG